MHKISRFQVKPKMHASFPTSSVESSTFEPKRSFVTFDDIGGCESQFMVFEIILFYIKLFICYQPMRNNIYIYLYNTKI